MTHQDPDPHTASGVQDTRPGSRLHAYRPTSAHGRIEGVTPDLVELSRTIDPAELGQRIRTARIAAGLTQADIAGADVSPAHISRIESGDRRLDNRLLQRIAARLDVTVEELLTGVSIDEQRQIELLLDYSEMALALGENTTALKHTTEAVRELDVPGLHNLRRRALHLHGLALEADGNLRQAIQTLEVVTSTPRTDTLWLRAVVALTRCYREVGDAGRAIELGEHAAVIARDLNLEGLSEANQLAIAIASAYMQRGDNHHALELYKYAIQASDERETPLDQALAYWHASATEAEHGAFDAALDLSKRALALLELGAAARDRARVRIRYAGTQLKTDPPNVHTAMNALEKAGKELIWSVPRAIDLAEHHLMLARAELELGNNDAAMKFITHGVDIAGDSPLLAAEAHLLRGRVAATEGDPRTANGAYERAAAILTGTAATPSSAQLWFELGSLFNDIDQRDAALDAFRRAGASTGLTSPSSSHPTISVFPA